MAKDINDKPLTIKDIREVLIPAMQKVFATKKDLDQFSTKAELQAFEQRAMETFATREDVTVLKRDLTMLKGDFAQFKNESLTNQDKILKDLEILMTEKVMGEYQKKKERKLWMIMIDAMREHKILSPKRLKAINELEVF